MLFDDEFIEALKDDPLAGTLRACNKARAQFREGQGWEEDEFEYLSEVLALFVEMEAAGIFPARVDFPDLSGDMQADCGSISRMMAEVEAVCNAELTKVHNQLARNRFRLALGTQFAYEFTNGDLDRVQQLLNELREQVVAADYFESDHKARVFARLEKLQAELHKKVSSLDRFWGLIGDAGVAAGKFGTDAKPLVDRVRELTQIVWRTQARAEELPSDAAMPSLENKPTDPAIDV